jgi:hypothetical protein
VGDPLVQAVQPNLVVLAEVPDPNSEQRVRKVQERLMRHGATVLRGIAAGRGPRIEVMES